MNISSTDGRQTLTDWVTLPGASCCRVRKDWAAEFQAAGLRSFADFFSFQGEALSKPGLGKRYRARLQLSAQRGPVYLKRYEGEKLSAFWRRWWEDGQPGTPTHRDVAVAESLQELGINAPQTLAWGAEEGSARSRRSFLVCASVPGEALDRWLDQHTLSFRDQCGLVHGLAAVARRFHQAGWCHRDFYLCHIFVAGSPGAFEFSIIDLQRVFRPRWRSWRWLIKDLAQLQYSAQGKRVTRAMQLRFFLRYLGQDCPARLTGSQKKMLQQILEKSGRIARHDRSRSLPRS